MNYKGLVKDGVESLKESMSKKEIEEADRYVKSTRGTVRTNILKKMKGKDPRALKEIGLNEIVDSYLFTTFINYMNLKEAPDLKQLENDVIDTLEAGLEAAKSQE